MDEGRTAFAVGAKVLMLWVCLALFVVCLAMVSLSMRAVLDVGGSCASGGPFEIETQCPRGVGWIMPVAIWVGLLALVGYVFAGRGLPGPKLIGLAWPALFLSLGWNFLDYGFDPPGDQGTSPGLVVCGVLFVVMGVVPLFVLASPAARHWMFWSDATPATGRQTYRDARDAATSFDWRKLGIVDIEGATRPADSGDPGAGTGDGSHRSYAGRNGGPSDDLIDRLERLTAMHRRGDLTADEFAAAKAQLLKEGGR